MSAVLKASIGAYAFLIKIYIIGWIVTWFYRICAGLKINSKNRANSEEEPDAILYAQSWEDPKILRKALRISDRDQVLAIASAGDSLLALLLDNPKRIVGIDSSFPQLALCHLKVAAIKALSFEEFRYFLGFSEEVADGRKRREIYRCALRSQLLVEVRHFWDMREALLSYGVIHCGRFEQYHRTFAELLLPLVHDQLAIQALVNQKGLSQQRDLFNKDWNTLQWRALHKFYYSEAMMRQSLGQHVAFRAMFDRADRSVGEQLLTRAIENLTEVPMASNYFMEYALTGLIKGKNSLPDYMQKENFPVLKARVNRLELVHGDLVTYLKSSFTDNKERRVYDAVHLSHLPEWVPDVEEVFRTILNCVKPGARIAHWKFLVDRKTERLFPKELRSEIKLSSNLKNDDRVFLYRDFIVQTCKPR